MQIRTKLDYVHVVNIHIWKLYDDDADDDDDEDHDDGDDDKDDDIQMFLL